MKGLRHEMISASAGSGKTYELVRRYLHLLMLGVEPERVAAMTFTRKAAGEFFNRILRRLSELSEGKTDPAQYFADMQPLPPQWPDFIEVTRQLLRHMHRLRLGTLDSFFATVAACFPMELGLPVGAAVMAEEDADRALDEALDGLMDAVYRNGEDEGAKTLLEAYKQGTYGDEGKSVMRSLRGWIQSAHQLWLECPDAAAWGGAKIIWPQRDAIVWHGAQSRAELAAKLRAFGTKQRWSDEGHDRWARMIAQFETQQPGLKVEKPLADILDKCLDFWPQLQNGDEVEITWMRRKTKFAGEDSALLVALVKQLASAEFLVRCHRTEGMASLINKYEAGYHQLVRQQGRLSFADVQRLLATAQESVFGAAGAGTPDLWYRMDARHDHWLFDEFQDTSVQQWQVVGGLVDEVLQDDSGRRSFFAVGDTKQSIYLWRRAEPGLFLSVEKRYHREKGDDGLKMRQLARSYRSCQQVLDAVNAVFGDEKRLDELLPGSLEGWDFADHVSAQPKLNGHVALLHEDESADDDIDTRWPVIARIINEIQPVRRNLTCAVIVSRNEMAAGLADYLRGATGLEVVTESQQNPATDNPVTLALLSLLQLAAHPGDTFAFEHVRMTPLASVLADEFQDDAGRAALETLRTVENDGIAAFVEKWSERIGEMDAFTSKRIEQLADLASKFDETGDRRIDTFLDLARNHGVRDSGVAHAVQVMTIHKSKGLEFDIVFLPDLDGNGMKTVRRADLLVKRPLFAPVEWVLQKPADVFAKLDPTLAGLKEQMARRECFQKLCALYVSMTRAKCGLYMVTKQPKSAVNESKLLHLMLQKAGAKPLNFGGVEIECAASIGDERWFEDHALEEPVSTPEIEAPCETIGALLRKVQPLARRLTPSEEESFRVTGEVLFAAGREKGRNFGSLVHNLLAEIEWSDGADEKTLRELWSARGFDLENGFVEAAGQVLALASSESTAHVFHRPRSSVTLWRERAFDLLHKDEWVSGVMDRVVIERDSSGTATSAWLIDFKTDSVENDDQLRGKVEGYTPQLTFYRTAISTLTGLGLNFICASLVFTRLKREVKI